MSIVWKLAVIAYLLEICIQLGRSNSSLIGCIDLQVATNYFTQDTHSSALLIDCLILEILCLGEVQSVTGSRP